MVLKQWWLDFKNGNGWPSDFFDLDSPQSDSMAFRSRTSFPVGEKFLISSHDRSGFGVLGNDFWFITVNLHFSRKQKMLNGKIKFLFLALQDMYRLKRRFSEDFILRTHYFNSLTFASLPIGWTAVFKSPNYYFWVILCIVNRLIFGDNFLLTGIRIFIAAVQLIKTYLW